MKLAAIGELKLIEKIRERFNPLLKGIVVGIGDDAAAVNINGSTLLLSTDTMTEGVHFEFAFVSPFQIGYKLIISNVSDIYAMGGRPEWVLLSVTVPPTTEESFFDDFFDGISEGMRKHGVTLIGGDVTSSKSFLTSSLTIVGLSGKKKIIRRSGASVGEKVYISGPIGEAACGFEVLKRIGRPIILEKGEILNLSVEWEVISPILKHFLLPEAQNLNDYSEHITSMIDISDGLFIDLTRLCNESAVGVRIYEEKIPLTDELREVSSIFGLDTYRLITSGGEDYQQLFTARYRLSEFIEIGEIIDKGLFIVRKDGSEEVIRPEGYEQFVSR